MCPATHTRRRSSPDLSSSKHSPSPPDWISESLRGGSLRRLPDPHGGGTNVWASPPGNLFRLRSRSYFSKRHKSPAGDYLLLPAGMDWLRSSGKLHNVLSRPDNRVAAALRRAQSQGMSLKSLLLAVNLQIPGKEAHSAVFYFAAEEALPPGSLLERFVNGSDEFRNSRLKIVNRIVKGPWVVKKTVGNYSACLLGRALTCNYHRGSNYLEIDVDIGSSAIATAILNLALGCVTSVTIDMGFVVEAQEEEDLPERLIGAIRICQMEMSSATVVDDAGEELHARATTGHARVTHVDSDSGKSSSDDDDNNNNGKTHKNN